VIPRVLGVFLAAIALWAPARVPAQVILDGTLRPENAGVSPFDPVAGEYVVDESIGTTAGSNLFHSFDTLSLGENDVLRFTGSPSIEHLIARVTGGAVSNIAGVIRSDLPNADLFLMNPAGLVFSSPNGVAQDPILTQGSFFASTADALQFADGSLFTAAGGEDASLILAEPSAWGFLGGGLGGTITTRATQFLQVPDGQVLSLVGSELVITDASTLVAEGGEIELAAVGDQATIVPLDLDGYSIDGLDRDGLGEIRIEAGIDSGSTLRTGNDASTFGRVVIRGGRLEITGASSVSGGGRAGPTAASIDIDVARDVRLEANGRLRSVSAAPEGPGGIRVRAGEITVLGELSEIQVSGLDGAAPGDLRLEADRVEVGDEATVSTTAFGSQRGANLGIAAGRLEIRDGALVETSTVGSGDAGDIDVDLSDPDTSLVLDAGGQLGSVSTGTGRGGDVTLVSEGRVLLDGEGIRAGSSVPSLLFSRSGRGPGPLATGGDAGALSIQSRTLELTGAAEVSVRSFGPGRSGIVTVDAPELVRLQGAKGGAPTLSSRTVDGDGGGVIEGQPGLVVRTDRLEVLDGASISTSSAGRGRGADVRIEAREVLLSSGEGFETAGVFSESLALDTGNFLPGEGDTGDLVLDVGTLDVAGGGEISIETQGPGAGQQIRIEAEGDVVLSGGTLRSNATADASAPAGDIVVRAMGDLRIGPGSLVTAESQSSGIGGAADAGDLDLRAEERLVVEGADVRTLADNTAGGRITLGAGERIDITRSRIESSVEGGVAATDAGNLSVAAPVIVIDESSLLAQAVLGDGGDISLQSDVLLVSAGSVIDASSELGVSGQVTTTAPDSDLLEGLVRLPAEFLDSAALLGSRCAARDRERGSFVVGGRTGLRESPLRPLSTPILSEVASRGEAPLLPFESDPVWSDREPLQSMAFDACLGARPGSGGSR
jgi:filamentous hemagglutinin family protein